MDWAGAIFLLLGRYYIGKNKNNIGLILSFVGDTLWMLVGFWVGNYTLIFTGGSMALLDLKGVFNRRGDSLYWDSMVIPKYQRTGYKSYKMK